MWEAKRDAGLSTVSTIDFIIQPFLPDDCGNMEQVKGASVLQQNPVLWSPSERFFRLESPCNSEKGDLPLCGFWRVLF